MAITYTGSGVISSSDYKQVKWTGSTKGGGSVEITIPKAINRENLDWTFVEKNDTVPTLTFENAYSNTDTMSTTYTEGWSVKFTPGSTNSNSGNIILGAGMLTIGSTDVALSRGGGSFTVEREYREINADGDRGLVEGRLVIDGSRAKLTVNALTFIANLDKLYPAITVTN